MLPSKFARDYRPTAVFTIERSSNADQTVHVSMSNYQSTLFVMWHDAGQPNWGHVRYFIFDLLRSSVEVTESSDGVLCRFNLELSAHCQALQQFAAALVLMYPTNTDLRRMSDIVDSIITFYNRT